MLDPGQFRLGARRQTVGPALIRSQFLVAPVALVERRVAQGDVRPQPGERIRTQGVDGFDLGTDLPALGREVQSRGGERGQGGVTLTPQQGQSGAVVLLGGRRDQMPRAAGRIEDREPAFPVAEAGCRARSGPSAGPVGEAWC